MKGLFRPKNPSKYQGNPTRIVYRSSWEMKVMSWLDLNENILSWASEEFCIVYFDPGKQRKRRYFPDFKVEVKDKTNDSKKTLILEVKPAHKLEPPKRGKKSEKTFITEMFEFAQNQAKFDAARAYCQERGYEFKILTEHDIGVL